MRWYRSRPRIRRNSSRRTTAPSSYRWSIAPARPRRTRSTRPTWPRPICCRKLTEIYANRAERVMFVKGDDDLNFAYIAEVIDIGHAANVDHIGLMTPKIHGRTIASCHRLPAGIGLALLPAAELGDGRSMSDVRRAGLIRGNRSTIWPSWFRSSRPQPVQ